jgi:hypothetical protein
MSPRTNIPDILADPFEEHRAAPPAQRMRLLGCDFEFASASSELQRIVA